MTHKKIFNLTNATFSLILTLYAATINAENGNQLTTDNHSFYKENAEEIKNKICKERKCTNHPFSKEMEEHYKTEYTELSLEDLNDDNDYEVILSSQQEGNVNNCSLIYTYDKDLNKFVEMSNNSNGICNFSTKDQILVSNYRSGAKWYEDIYSVEGKKLTLLISDACVGCGEVSRTIFSKNGNQQFIVTDASEYTQREKISTRITRDKTYLYAQPKTDSKGSSYLIKNDQVNLLEYSYNEETDWYKVRYHSAKGKNIDAWVKCEDISYCAEKP